MPSDRLTQARPIMPATRDIGVGIEKVRLRPVRGGVAKRLAGSLRRYARPGNARSVRAQVKRKVARAASTEGGRLFGPGLSSPSTSVDFADGLLAATSEGRRMPVYSFDTGFRRLSVDWEPPG